MTKLAYDFAANLRAGMRLAFFQRCGLEDFKFGLDQLALLLGLDLLLEIGSGWTLRQPGPDFNAYALLIYAFGVVCIFIAGDLLGLLTRRKETLLRICVLVYSFGPLTILLNILVNHPALRPASLVVTAQLGFALSIYTMTVLYRALYLTTDRNKTATGAGFLLMVAATALPAMYFQQAKDFWLAADSKEATAPAIKTADTKKADIYADYRALDAEALMYRQPEILNRELGKLAPQRKKTKDLFFVGFAGYAIEDVFSKEVAYAKRLFDERFDTAGHSINLVNHLRTMDTTALATGTNLAATLKHIGQLMDTEEDVLVLYLTSHGSQAQGLSVYFWPLALNNIAPEKLNAMLDEAGIKWRVVIVSACYSGGFVKPLQGPGTVVATAAADDRQSFGCGNESDFTYFGEAIFKDQLHRHYSLVTALQEAGVAIGEREAREKLTPSLPQLSVGEKIAPKLQRLAEELQERQCAAAKTGTGNC